jgi:Ca-activated chloride channel family protein
MSVVGVGDLDPTLPAAIGSIGAGRYSVAESGADLTEIFRAEGETTLLPLALDFRMTVEPAPGYRVGRIYGARRAFVQDGTVVVTSPGLYLGLREGSRDVGGGRRSGGSGLFVELRADGASGIGAGAPAFIATATWTRTDGTTATTSAEVRNDLAPGENPAEMFAQVSAGGAMKPFMMLNMYLALRAMSVLHEDGDCTHARGVWDMMTPGTLLYQERFGDPDIAADRDLLNDLRMNLDSRCEPVAPIQPVTFDGGCMIS